MGAPKNEPAPGIPYFIPLRDPPAGTALSPNPPTLFRPLKIRDVAFQNRIWVAPMCQYSADDGHLTDYHLVHLGGMAFRGASLTIVEATAVLPEGRITPEDTGLWKDSQIAPLKRVADFVHSQGQKLGIQLAHAGRKASTVAPWLVPQRGRAITATEDANGWPNNLKAPSAIRWGEDYAMPKEMTKDDIKEVIQAFRDSARRSVEAGVDVIEIHSAHGYLLHSWISPLSNHRTDEYGGSFENRIRLPLEIVKAVREVIPSGMPLLYRISAADYVDDQPSWDVEQSIAFAKLLPAAGVDLLDVSAAGNSPNQKIAMHTNYQIEMCGRIRREVLAAKIPLLFGAVGMITEAEQAKSIVEFSEIPGEAEQVRDIVETRAKEEPLADIVLVARQFMREPEWVLRVAYRLGIDVQWPTQYHRGTFVSGSKI